MTTSSGHTDSAPALGTADVARLDAPVHPLVDAALAMVWMSSPDKFCTYFNQGWLEFTGRSMEQELGDGWAEGIHPDDVDRCRQIYTSSFDKREPFAMEYRLRRRDGVYRWILDHGVPRYGPAERFEGYTGLCIDITPVQQAHLELQESEQRFRATFDQAAVGMAIVGREGRWLRVNDKLCDIVGFTREELLRMSAQDIAHPEDAEACRAAAQRLLDGSGSSYTMETRYIRNDGAQVWLHLTVSLVRTATGAPDYFIKVIDDISERKRLEAEHTDAIRREQDALAHASAARESDSLKTLLLASVTHELRTPLAAIKAAAATLRLAEIPSGSAEWYELTELIENSATRLNRLATDLLDLSRMEAGIAPPELDWQWMDEIITAALEQVRQAGVDEGRLIQLDVADDLPPVRVDYRQIEQVLVNLLENALKYSPPSAPILLRATTADHSLQIHVRDFGIGVESEHIARVFEKFYREPVSLPRRPDKPPQGHGLGLAICKSIVLAHGGQIEMKSERAQGTTVWFTIPLEAPRGHLPP